MGRKASRSAARGRKKQKEQETARDCGQNDQTSSATKESTVIEERDRKPDTEDTNLGGTSDSAEAQQNKQDERYNQWQASIGKRLAEMMQNESEVAQQQDECEDCDHWCTEDAVCTGILPNESQQTALAWMYRKFDTGPPTYSPANLMFWYIANDKHKSLLRQKRHNEKTRANRNKHKTGTQ